MFLVYVDFGPNGANIRTLDKSRRVGQYVIFSAKTPLGPFLNIPQTAQFQALTIALHDLTTDSIVWFKHRFRDTNKNTSVTEDERKMLFLQAVASEVW